MLDLNLIREQPDLVRTALRNRQMDPSPVGELLRLDEKRRALLTQVETLKAERNVVSKAIGSMRDAAEREQKIAAMREVGEKIAALDKEVAEVEAELPAKTITSFCARWVSCLNSISNPNLIGIWDPRSALLTLNAVPRSPDRASMC